MSLVAKYRGTDKNKQIKKNQDCIKHFPKCRRRKKRMICTRKGWKHYGCLHCYLALSYFIVTAHVNLSVPFKAALLDRP